MNDFSLDSGTSRHSYTGQSAFLIVSVRDPTFDPQLQDDNVFLGTGVNPSRFASV